MCVYVCVCVCVCGNSSVIALNIKYLDVILTLFYHRKITAPRK